MSTTSLDQQLTGVADQFDEEGYVVVRQAIDQELIEEARNHIEWLRGRHPDTRPENLGHWLIKDDPFWVRLVSDQRLLDVAERFVGPNIALFASHYLAKPPRDGQPVLWHQDGSYWPLESMEVVTLWLAIDESTPENGCLRVIPGTHTLDLQEVTESTEVENVLSSEMSRDLVEESKAVDLVLNPGDVSIHHPNVIHGSNANTSPKWRRGLTIRYIPTSTRVLTDEPWPSLFLLRGNAVAGINQYGTRPRFEPSHHMAFRGSERWH